MDKKDETKTKKLNEEFDKLIRMNQQAFTKYFLLSDKTNDGAIEFWLLLGADPNANKQQAMKRAVAARDLNKIKLLQKYGADTEIDLSEVIKTGDVELVDYMLSTIERESLLSMHHLQTAMKTENEEIIDQILKHKTIVTGSHMQRAVNTSLDMVMKLLPHTDNKFPRGSFDGGKDIWDYTYKTTNDVLEYVLRVLESEPKKLSEAFDEPGKGEPYYIEFNLGRDLERTVEVADFQRMKIIFDYFKRNKKKVWIRSEKLICQGLSKNAKSSEEFNAILRLLKDEEVIENMWQEKKNTELMFTNQNATMETFEIFGVEITPECYAYAISSRNERLIKELIEKGITPN